MLRERLATLLASIPGALLIGQAAGAQEALLGIREKAAEVVVLDIQLEQGSGFDVLRELQKSSPGTEVYMLTNFASESYRKAAERYGARGFFDKSTEFERLREVLVKRAAA